MDNKLQDIENRIREYDDRLIREAERLVYLHREGATWLELDATVGFMDTLQAHRRLVLSEYSRAGGRVVDVHNFGAHVQNDEEGEAVS